MIKQIGFIFIGLLSLNLFSADKANSKITENCSLIKNLDKTKKLFGDVHIVNSGENYKVRIVDFNPDLKVQVINNSPSHCGEWRLVNFNGDFSVRFVESGEDFTIQFVNFNPGLN